MRKVLTALAMLALCAHAQFTPIYNITPKGNTLPANKPYIIGAYDAENNAGTSYMAYLSNDKAVIANFETGLTETTIEVKNAVDTSYTLTYIYFYKNFLASDGKWTGIMYEYDSKDPGYKMSLLSNGVKTATTIKSTGMPSIMTINNKIYLYVADTESRALYLVRNYTPAISAVPRQMQAAPVNIGENAVHFNVLGQQLSPAQYQELDEILKKTTFSK